MEIVRPPPEAHTLDELMTVVKRPPPSNGFEKSSTEYAIHLVVCHQVVYDCTVCSSARVFSGEECPICMDALAMTRFLPCNHCVCANCAQGIRTAVRSFLLQQFTSTVVFSNRW